MKTKLLIAIVVALMAATSAFSQESGNASDGSVNLGKITVYKFEEKPVSYTITRGGEKKHETIPSAVGYEKMADLYVTKIGNNTYFKIQIEGEIYAVVSRPSGERFIPTISLEYTWINKNCDYVKVPTLSHKAGPYFLNVPYRQSNDSQANTGQSNGNVNSNNTQTASASNNNSGLQKFVGVWRGADNDFGDIKISVNNGKLNLQMKTDKGFKSFEPRVDGDMISWSYEGWVDYGKWDTYSDQFNTYHYLVGEGYSYNDKVEVYNYGVWYGRKKANKEVMRNCFSAKFKNGNLEITKSYKFDYYDDSGFQFYRRSDYKTSATYTQW